jgi:hypothetical protein
MARSLFPEEAALRRGPVSRDLIQPSRLPLPALKSAAETGAFAHT